MQEEINALNRQPINLLALKALKRLKAEVIPGRTHLLALAQAALAAVAPDLAESADSAEMLLLAEWAQSPRTQETASRYLRAEMDDPSRLPEMTPEEIWSLTLAALAPDSFAPTREELTPPVALN